MNKMKKKSVTYDQVLHLGEKQERMFTFHWPSSREEVKKLLLSLYYRNMKQPDLIDAKKC